MAHNLDRNGNDAAFASARESAWHQLGTVVDDAMTAQQAMELAHLGGWDVRKQEMWTTAPDGSPLIVPSRSAIVRNSPWHKNEIDVLGVAGTNTYTIVQNEQHAELLNTLVDESGAHFETAGAINGGKTVFISMKLPDSMLIGGVDAVDTYIVAVNSHDGSSAFKLITTPVRVVCENTLNYAMDSQTHRAWKARHTSRVEYNLRAQAREALELTFKQNDEFATEAEQLINTTMTQTQFEEIVRNEFGTGGSEAKATVTRADKRFDELVALFTEAGTQEGVRETAWAGLNALTEWSDHFAPARGSDPDAARAARAVLMPEFKDKAHRVITQFAGV